MMADAKKAVIIIKKKKGGGGHAPHGGAWKVAYADFVTAMMCFFLVMWLMGSDEETKAAISEYFNNPTTPWYERRPKTPQANVAPVGENAGVGDNVLRGLDGLVPDTLVQDPIRPLNTADQHKEIGDLASELTDGQAYAIDITIDYVKFSVPEDLLFKQGTAQLHTTAPKYLDRLGQLFRGYKGYIVIEGHTDDPPSTTGPFSNAYEYSMARAVSVMNYFIEHHWVNQEKITPVGSGGKRQLSPNTTAEGRKLNRRVEFTLTYHRNR